MRTVALALLLMLAVPLPAGAQSCPPLRVDFGNDACLELDVHLEADRGGTLTFLAPESSLEGPGGSQLESDQNAERATLDLICVCTLRTESITLTMQRGGADTWTASLAVNDPRLVEGTWLAKAAAVRGPVTYQSQGATVEVVAPEVGNLIVRALNTDSTGTVNVGRGQHVQIAVLFENATPAPLVRRVEYKIGAQSAVEWQAPYLLAAENFQPPGRFQLQVMVEDRLGRTRQIGFGVAADTVDPVVTPSTPATLYQGIPNQIVLAVTEHSSYTAVARAAGVQGTATGTGTGVVELALVPQQLGSTLLEIVVTDRVGNQVRLLESTTVERLRSDIVLVEAVQSNAPAIPGEDVELTVRARQIDGLADVPVNVTYDGVLLGQMVVNKTTVSEGVFMVQAAPGRHTGTLALSVPAAVNELDTSNQVGNATVERFLARVLHGADRYHIRADDSGLPLEAVGASGTTYPLRLEDSGLGTVYAFTVEGQRLYWHPASTTTTVPEEDPDGDDDNGIPGFLLLPLSAVLLAAAGGARRRTLRGQR